MGLPGETEEDVDDLVRFVAELREIGALEEGRKRGRMATLIPSVNAFIPKPHTPFENEHLEDPDVLQARKLKRLERAFKKMPNVEDEGDAHDRGDLGGLPRQDGARVGADPRAGGGRSPRPAASSASTGRPSSGSPGRGARPGPGPSPAGPST